MKTTSLRLILVAAFWFGGTFVRAADGAAVSSVKVGVYDSRAVAFAYFWTDAAKQKREALMAEARAAKGAGDDVRFKQLAARLSDLQKRDHLQVFSSAPANEAMAALHDRIPALQAELGVDRFVSKWDVEALRAVPESARVDVTDRLTRELFTPTPKQQKTLDAMKSKSPLPLEKARELADAGKL